jgi:DNA-binding MarR family transcriptional regulator
MSNGRVSFSTTEHIRDHCLCLHTQRAARAIARRFDRVLSRLGLTNGQFSLMMALNRPEPVSMGPVAALLGMDRTTLTAALKSLEQRRMIATTYSSEDKRSRLLRLTSQGHAILAKAVPIWEEAHAEVDRSLAGYDLDQFRPVLRVLG